MKTQVLGPDKEDSQQVRVLNRMLTWNKDGASYEADPRHAGIVIEELGLKGAKGVVTPGTKEEGTTKDDHEEKLDEHGHHRYRAIVARLNYLATERPDIAFSVNELARSMSSPTRGCQKQCKIFGRAVINSQWQSIPDKLRIFTDADWAGCKTIRKSTSGGCVVLGTHALETWRNTQTLVALSLGESEFYAALEASVEGLGVIAMLKDLGYDVKGEVLGDASAALGIIRRRGLSRTRRIDTGLLCIQQTGAEKRLQYSKVLGTENHVDLMTKYLTADVNEKPRQRLHVQFTEGRAATAPTLSKITKKTKQCEKWTSAATKKRMKSDAKKTWRTAPSNSSTSCGTQSGKLK